MNESEELNLEELFRKATLLGDKERERFLIELECRDPGIADELRSLIAADESAGLLPEEPVPSPLPESLLVAAKDASHANEEAQRATISQIASFSPMAARYERGEELGHGAMGTVSRVHDRALQRQLAMKTMRSTGQSTESSGHSALGRFVEEARVTGQLEHPGIVPVHDLGVDSEGHVFFTMPCVRGRHLGEIFELAQGGGEGWNRTRVLGVLQRVCEAMSYAHAQGVLHRDLKPANIMVGSFGEVYVMDWGVARRVGERDEHDLRVRTDGHGNQVPTESPVVTMDGTVVGTPHFMPREQAKGRREEVDQRADVYAVGAMLYLLLVGHEPYLLADSPNSPHQVLMRIVREAPTPVSQLATGAPAELVAVCEKAMAWRAEDRYPDMLSLAEDLRAFLEHRVVTAYETGAWAEGRKWVQRNRLLAAALAGAVLILVLGLGATLQLRQEAQENYILAEGRRTEAEASGAKAIERARQVQRLSALQDYDELMDRVDALWPAHPENIEAFENWIDEADALVAQLPVHRAKLEELRAAALPLDKEVHEVGNRDHRDAPRLSALAGLISARRMALNQRRDGVEAPAYHPDWGALPLDMRTLNKWAWELVAPDRRVFGREAEGLAIAERAMELAEDSADDSMVAAMGDTISRALFALGRDAEALEASQNAVEVAPAEWREGFQRQLEELEGWIEEAAGDVGLSRAVQEIAALERERDLLKVRISERRSWSFPDDEEGGVLDWWHTNLSRLIVSLEGLVAEETGLLSDFDDAVSAQHGWSVRRRLAFAERLRMGLKAGGDWSTRWAEASAAIREHPGYGGLTLKPQVGLVPIGPDPVSGLWEFWHVVTGAEPARDQSGALVLTEEVGAVMVLIPAGTFWMGASATPGGEHNFDPQARMNEEPVHLVELSAYFLSKYELTQGQWERFTSQNPSYYQPPSTLAPSLLHPVEQVSWLDCVRELPRMGLTLPSEAQWENGCRAGTETPWHFGAERESLRGMINIADKTAADGGAVWSDLEDWPDNVDGGFVHREVGAYEPNAYGLHEVHGNVFEWCRDESGSGFYGRVSKVDPIAVSGDQSLRVRRGGSFDTTATHARSALRLDAIPSVAIFSQGVRPAMLISD